jgi:Methyltransferase domain
VNADLDAHLASFRAIWNGGFFVGDPLDRTHSPFGLFGYVGVPHAIALACIRPYVTPETVALEIGPGRGAYTKAMLAAHEIWVLDALSAEHNHFWDYVGEQPHLHYVHVTDFSCESLPDDGIDFMFSYDALCHVPFDGIAAYADSLLQKLRPGAHCFWMVADYAKYKRFIAARPSVSPALTSQVGRPWLRRLLQSLIDHVELRELDRYRRHIELPEGPEGSWWYDAGTERTAAMLEGTGYRVVELDVGIDPRSPIIHFVRP